MTKYLLDTCALSDFFAGVPATKARLAEHSPSEIAISTVTLMEVLYGLALNPSASRRFGNAFRSLCESIDVFPFNEHCAEIAAAIRATTRKRGTPVGSFDLLIASTALANQCILVTSNTREFAYIEELPLENWR